MNWNKIAYYIGVSLLMVAALMLVSGIIACDTPGDSSRMPLLYSAFVTGAAGFFPLIYVRKDQSRLSFREGNCIVVGAWVAACIFGMLPFLLYGGEFTLINALFESVSGFTTTGASILNDIEALPRGLQFWRISTAWVGGIGIVTLFSIVMTESGEKAILSGAEISSLAREPFEGERKFSFARRMIITYVSLSIASSLLLRVTGMPWFDAVTNAMSACSTCGFCIRNESIAFYDNPFAEAVLIVTMIAAGINFGVLFISLIKGRPARIWKSASVRTFVISLCIATAIISANLLVGESGTSFWNAIRDASFQVASIATTTGFATQDTTQWPALSMTVLIICSLICGCSGSTSGGIKIDRAILAAKGIGRKVSQSISPNRVKAVKVDGRIQSDSQVDDAFCYIVCYLVLVVIFASVNIAAGQDFTTGLTASVACIGNVGPGFGEVGSMANYSAFPALLKVSGMLEMLVGRLEIFPILYLAGSFRTRF